MSAPLQSALLRSLADGFAGSGAQQDVLDAVLRSGLPAARNEAWKYTSLRALERRSFDTQSSDVPTVEPAFLAGIPAPRLVFVNGRYDASLTDLACLGAGVDVQQWSAQSRHVADDLPLLEPEREAPFAHLALALANEGITLRVAAGVHVATPIAIVQIGAPLSADAAWHLRFRIVLETGASATLIEHQLQAGPHAHLANCLTTVEIAASASLLHARVQDESVGATLFAQTHAVLHRDARYDRVDLELGAALSRHQFNVRLDGDGANLVARGVQLGAGRRQLDTRLHIDHAAARTGCDLLWRGVAGGRSRCVFHGGILIRPGADGSDARLSNKNLLLSDTAEIDTQPVLEIHADEVKAAHGATVGQLDPTALFYLRSRGIAETHARQLLTAAFCREVISPIRSTLVREQLFAALDRALTAQDLA